MRYYVDICFCAIAIKWRKLFAMPSLPGRFSTLNHLVIETGRKTDGVLPLKS